MFGLLTGDSGNWRVRAFLLSTMKYNKKLNYKIYWKLN